jgi:methionyl-tRNA formyltransferase
MNIVFMGTPEFAVPSLEILCDHGYRVTAVVTGQDKPRGRGREITFTAVKACALRRGLAVYQPATLKDPETARRVASFGPDLLVVVAFRILPSSIYTIAPLGAFNLHASLLPKLRGAAPINWALINGETETGVTTFFLEEKVDTGAMILQLRSPVLPDDDAGTLHDRLAILGAEAVLETTRRIEAGTAVPLPQVHAEATPAPKISREFCRIDWTWSAPRLHNFVRGLSPSPAAYTTHLGRLIKIFRTAIEPWQPGGAPGQIVLRGGDLLVMTGDGALRLMELQVEGRRRMTAAEFLRGYVLHTGSYLAS